MLATDQLELDIVAELNRQAGRRLSSGELTQISLMVFLEQTAQRDPSAMSSILLRIALKASPYARNSAEMLAAHREITRVRAARDMPALLDRIAACESRGLPLPVILSCERYLDSARRASRAFAERYFGIVPIIITGGDDSAFEQNDAILRLPVSDVYEALPFKVFETLVFLDAIGSCHGVIKIDDDTHVERHAPLDFEDVRSAFATVDYMGLALSSPHHDRTWHQGKCATAVTPVYGKPFVAPWARGALYFLSKRAIGKLTDHYLRFPGCLAGELYEDKAVGDVLHALGIGVVDMPLERLLHVRTDAPERGVAAAA
jgi:hypothetical protein